MPMKSAKTVEEYITQAPTQYHEKLRELRAAILSIVPRAHESISYNMPFYDYKGKLVYFCLWKNHIGLYALDSSVLSDHEKELEGLVREKGTVQFPLSEKLPTSLIKKLILAQRSVNEAKA